MLFLLLLSSGGTTSVTYVRSSDQRSFVESISRSFCQVSSSLFLNLQRRKLQLRATGEKTNDIMLALEKMIYIEYDRSATKTDKDEKILTMRRLL